MDQELAAMSHDGTRHLLRDDSRREERTDRFLVD
jgi:hypothetical protein